MKRVLLTAVLLLLPCIAHAQSITSWTLKVSNQGASQPLSTTVLQVANVACNQTAPAANTSANPSKVLFDDPANVGKVCIWTDPGTGPLFSVPFGGNYQATLAATNTAGTSADSVPALFTRPGLIPGVPTGVKLVP